MARSKLRWNGEFESSEEQHRLKRRVILREVSVGDFFRSSAIGHPFFPLTVQSSTCFFVGGNRDRFRSSLLSNSENLHRVSHQHLLIPF